ncbi:hypothetical protein CAPTEDRAFT_221035 [Capitella teleta]|uniref:Endonuclease/exonuclease/phosphatase domain-containing protein n=1 Tax=Capitella teleta TaxID=283909 RepID=R7TV76_CAPTE|nr:hypothetical protein CAPTEDRAFT_221035 [Capitella teleta]|eukprot:ELT94910.1 hypothetical protein CAPTEDRAFT_221035 [Capitella teleta]
MKQVQNGKEIQLVGRQGSEAAATAEEAIFGFPFWSTVQKGSLFAPDFAAEKQSQGCSCTSHSSSSPDGAAILRAGDRRSFAEVVTAVKTALQDDRSRREVVIAQMPEKKMKTLSMTFAPRRHSMPGKVGEARKNGNGDVKCLRFRPCRSREEQARYKDLSTKVRGLNQEVKDSGVDSTVHQFMEEFGDYLSSVMSSAGQLLIVGDFNFHLNEPDDRDARTCTELMTSFSLQQRVHGPTHRSGHTLDLVLTHLDDNLIGVSSQFRRSWFSRALAGVRHTQYEEATTSTENPSIQEAKDTVEGLTEDCTHYLAHL